jgi:hypothetical protein
MARGTTVPDVAYADNPYDAWDHGPGIIRVDNMGSARAAKEAAGLIRPRRDPDRVRVTCGIDRCFREAHERRLIDGYGGDDPADWALLCTFHAEMWDDEVEATRPPAIDEDAEGDDLMVASAKAASRTIRTALGRPEPEARPKREAPPELAFLRDPEAEAAMAKSVRSDHRRAVAITLGVPATAARLGGKSKLGRTPEYRRVEKRRQMARREGLDPNELGPEYRLPTMKTLHRVSRHPRLPSRIDHSAETPRGRR